MDRARAWVRIAVATVAVVAFTLAAASVAEAAVGQLTAQGCVKDVGKPASCAAENQGLAGAYGVAVSSDGKSVYATGLDDDAVTMLQRDPTTGALTPAGCISDADNFPGSGCADFQEGLADPFGIAVSPDGLDVYVAAEDDDAIVHLERDPTTGDLSGIGCIADTGDAAGCGGPTQAGLTSPRSLVVDPDGAAVYVAATGTIVRLARNPSTGGLGVGGSTSVAGFTDIYDIAISPDGESLHAVSRTTSGLASFAAPGLGTLNCFYDADAAAIGGCSAVQGLTAGRGITVSPDGKSLYAASAGDSVISLFNRGLTGSLTPAGCIGDAGTSLCPASQQGLGTVNDVVVSPDSASLYAVGEENAIASFSRDPATGALAGQGCFAQTPDLAGCGVSLEGLQTGRGVAMSPDSKSVYVASFGRAAVTRFDREPSGTAPPPVDPPNDISFRAKKSTCKAACKTVKVKLKVERPGRIAVCTYPGRISNCPYPSGTAVRAGDKPKKLIKTKVMDVAGGDFTATVKTTKLARKKLAKKNKLKFDLQVDYRPTGGSLNSERQKLKVKRKA